MMNGINELSTQEQELLQGFLLPGEECRAAVRAGKVHRGAMVSLLFGTGSSTLMASLPLLWLAYHRTSSWQAWLGFGLLAVAVATLEFGSAFLQRRRRRGSFYAVTNYRALSLQPSLWRCTYWCDAYPLRDDLVTCTQRYADGTGDFLFIESTQRGFHGVKNAAQFQPFLFEAACAPLPEAKVSLPALSEAETAAVQAAMDEGETAVVAARIMPRLFPKSGGFIMLYFGVAMCLFACLSMLSTLAWNGVGIGGGVALAMLVSFFCLLRCRRNATLYVVSTSRALVLAPKLWGGCKLTSYRHGAERVKRVSYDSEGCGDVVFIEEAQTTNRGESDYHEAQGLIDVPNALYFAALLSREANN